MTKLSSGNMIFDAKEFADSWGVWQSKGHSPAQKLRVFETRDSGQVLFSVGLLDYLTLEKFVFPSVSLFTTYEQAFADVGRALDKA